MYPKSARRDKLHKDRKKEAKKLGWAESVEFEKLCDEIEKVEFKAICEEEQPEFRGHLDDPCWCKRRMKKSQKGCYRYEDCKPK